MTSQETPSNASVSVNPSGESTQQDHESEAPRLVHEEDPFNSRVETETDATHPPIVTSPPPPVTASGPPPNMSGPEVVSPPAPETRTEQPRANVHPQVAALKSMFPDFDDALLYVHT